MAGIAPALAPSAIDSSSCRREIAVCHGLWRSLVAHLTGGQGVAGSNPVSPTKTRTAPFRAVLFLVLAVRSQDLGGSNPVGCRRLLSARRNKKSHPRGGIFCYSRTSRGSRRFEALPGQRMALTGCNGEPCGAARPCDVPRHRNPLNPRDRGIRSVLPGAPEVCEQLLHGCLDGQ